MTRSRTTLAALNRIATLLEKLSLSAERIAEELSAPKTGRVTGPQLDKIRSLIAENAIPTDTFMAVLRSYRVSRVGLLTQKEASDLIGRIQGTKEPHIEGGKS